MVSTPTLTLCLSHMILSVPPLPHYAIYQFCGQSETITKQVMFREIKVTKMWSKLYLAKIHSNCVFRYLFQFVFISIFYIFTWVLFELLPHIVPTNQPEWYSVVPVLVTLNCSSNSIIYLSINLEVQKSLQIPWLRKKLARGNASSTVQVIQARAAKVV